MTNLIHRKGSYFVLRLVSSSIAVAAILFTALNVSTGAAAPISAAAKPTAVPRTSGGDIPDTATYLRYHAGPYSIEYVEGWVSRILPGGGVRVSDISSYEMVTLQARPSQSLNAYVRGTGSARSAREYRHFVRTSVTPVSLPAGKSMRLSFKALSTPNTVTGKQVTLLIDRYYIPGQHHLAVITLATPVGVDNVDAFRRMSRSFTWIKG